MPFIDSHAHLHPEDSAVEALIHTMDACVIQQTFVVAGGTVPRHELRRRLSGYTTGPSLMQVDNQRVLTQCRTKPDRLRPFFFANPWVSLDEYMRHGGEYWGLKLAPMIHGFSFSDTNVEHLVHWAERWKHPVYSHCLHRDGVRVDDFMRLAERHRSIKFILGHAGIGHADFAAIDLVQSISNIFVETSGCMSGLAEYALKAMGPTRVIFGTEYPLQHPEVELTKWSTLNLEDDEREAVMGGNILKLTCKERPQCTT